MMMQKLKALSSFRTMKADQDNGSTSWDSVMLELNEKSQMEDLRQHLKNNRIFPKHVNPDTAPIKMEYLQKLARAWKLHHQRGFWRENPLQADLVRVLYAHHLHLQNKTKEGRKESDRDGKERRGNTSLQALASFASIFKPYTGDKFGTRGSYLEGSIYASRMQPPGSQPLVESNKLELKLESDKKAKTQSG